ncbi:MAG: hypothetical protein LBG70_04185 [Bifidobacteriaceae bacterium]|nr:hypothetical protein [Bifidobacteriaceae bacterium]
MISKHRLVTTVTTIALLVSPVQLVVPTFVEQSVVANTVRLSTGQPQFKVRYVVKGHISEIRYFSAGQLLGKLPSPALTELKRGEMFKGWWSNNRRVKETLRVNQPLRLVAKIVSGPKVSKDLLQHCPSDSWGRDSFYGDKWVCFEGVIVDPDLKRVLPLLERDLRAAGLIAKHADLGDYFVQGAYHRGFSASGGTHDRGGVIDLQACLGTDRALRILRRWALAAWHRPAGSVSAIDHVHAVLIGSNRLHPLAASQVKAYRSGLDGLQPAHRDTGPRLKRIQTWREVLKQAKRSAS